MARLPPSPYASQDPTKHQRELATPHPDEVFEFYGPFAFVENVAEVVRVLNPEYGPMEMLVVLPPKPTMVYVNSEAGERYLRTRYSTVPLHRVPPQDLKMSADEGGQVLRVYFKAGQGPLRWLSVAIRAIPGRPWETERYESPAVWGSKLRCHGVDLRVPARVEGSYQRANELMGHLLGEANGILYLGSFGRITPQPKAGP